MHPLEVTLPNLPESFILKPFINISLFLRASLVTDEVREYSFLGEENPSFDRRPLLTAIDAKTEVRGPPFKNGVYLGIQVHQGEWSEALKTE